MTFVYSLSNFTSFCYCF